MLKYTICFIRQGDNILLINREKPSWMGSWNGVGGKLEKGETPEECILREVLEETSIRLQNVEYKGVVTWVEDGIFSGGMYAFVADIPKNFSYITPKKVREGILDWKNISWILNSKNTGVALNIPMFLPKMLNENNKYEHICVFEEDRLLKVKSISLNSNYGYGQAN